ncbi:RNA-guided endonuclease TnpB family protein [Umezawaea sp. Da 62-37]|uniref:RNA-guided endonuclease InsQ/TnpB family protein n=1 Tax=Umezawaea sp. Da 62-37 TaxID=3075927 RepID=UPI0028F7494C|nr:RNA-guided endonuclease TnpB family protein [Umezawaea sp. Da 62-37]WNV90545.1 RNA-guided endonuclease TnpB family protein [Umezawaea sp. Da 62-37]
MPKAVVKRAYRYRFHPTEGQAVELSRTFGCIRLVYNRALDIRTNAWRREQRRVGYTDTSALLTAWKQTDELGFLKEVSSVPLQQILRHQQKAFTRFFDEQANYPRFKSRKRSRASAEYTRSGFRWRDGRLTLAKMDQPLAIVWSRPLPDGAQPSTVTVSRDPAGRWHVSILVETTIDHLAPTTAEVGVDAGLTSLMTLSTGEKITNPRHEHRGRVALARAQRNLARKAKDSNNRAKARVKVARVHARIADRRRDLLHKLTTRLVRENQTIVIEDLAVRNMVRNHNLARAINDAAWSEFRSMLTYKAAWYGRTVIAVDRWYPSSKTCSHCRHLLDTLPLGVRQWTCPGCGEVHDRDVNAARNILAAGRAVTACGDGIRPNRHQSVGHLSEPPFQGGRNRNCPLRSGRESPVLDDREGRQAELPPESGCAASATSFCGRLPFFGPVG